MSLKNILYFWTCFGVLSFVRICLSTGWIIPVYDVRSQERFAFAEDFLRLILLEQSEAVGGPFMEYALAPLDKEGYIINEDGQVVPFRIFKKGGAQLHPRNCRGGFHKRLTDEPGEQEAESIYNFRVSKRGSRLKSVPRKRQNNLPKYPTYDDEIFLPKSELDETHTVPKIDFTPEELSFLKEYSLLKSNSISPRSKINDLETFENLDKFMNQPSKQSRTATEYQKLVIPKYGISDKKSYTSFDPYSRDSSLSVELPFDTLPLHAYRYLPDGSIEDVTSTEDRSVVPDYDVLAYPIEIGRRR